MSSINWFVFILIWVLTFIPCWVLLARLVAKSASLGPIDLRFVAEFIFYRLLIVSPYVYLLIVGAETLPSVVNGVIGGFLVTAFALSFLRFFFRSKLIGFMWNVYGYVYDGLLKFYPYRKLQDLIVKTASPRSGDEILDLGCGTGNTTTRILQNNPEVKVTAVDGSPIMLKVFRKKIAKKEINDNSLQILQQNIETFLSKSANCTFDTIIMTNVLYALKNRHDVWPKLLKMLKPDGKIIVTSSDRRGSWPIIKEHMLNDSIFKLLLPKLFAVFVIDYFISQLSRAGAFSFIPADVIEQEVEASGGKFRFVSRCYGGDIDGVNILFSITHPDAKNKLSTQRGKK